MKYREKPVVIEAIQFDGTSKSLEQIFNWAPVKNEGWRKVADDREYSTGSRYEILAIIIPTLEGDMTAHPGDYIIKGVKGEFYPCRPDIFEMTYEKAIE